MSLSEISQGQEQEVAGFIAKLFQILNQEEYSKIILWGSSGKDFIIKDINKMQEIVLPKYFRHKKINSFIRQLNMYGFHKSRKDNAKSIFSHSSFIKGREDLLPTIKRKIKSLQNVAETPLKQRVQQDKITPLTTIKDQQPLKKLPQIPSNQILKGFLESREYLGSMFNLSISLKKISMNELGEHPMIVNNEEDKLSIELDIEDREEDLRNIVSPSFFFNSFKECSLK